MGRMHSKGNGISRRSLPYRKAPPSWVQISASDLTEQIIKSRPTVEKVTLRRTKNKFQEHFIQQE